MLSTTTINSGQQHDINNVPYIQYMLLDIGPLLSFDYRYCLATMFLIFRCTSRSHRVSNDSYWDKCSKYWSNSGGN
jgi:hypothetical protein